MTADIHLNLLLYNAVLDCNVEKAIDAMSSGADPFAVFEFSNGWSAFSWAEKFAKDDEGRCLTAIKEFVRAMDEASDLDDVTYTPGSADRKGGPRV